MSPLKFAFSDHSACCILIALNKHEMNFPFSPTFHRYGQNTNQVAQKSLFRTNQKTAVIKEGELTLNGHT